MNARPRALLLLLLLAASAALLPFLHYLTDDTFIHFQFAKHLVQGKGFSFNDGEPTYGATSPLWVLLLALAGKVLPIQVAAPADAWSMPDLAWVAKTLGLVAHLLSPEETLLVMRDSYGQFAPVLDKARAASQDYFNKNDNYRTFGKAAEWFAPTGWPGPVTAAAAEVQATNVLTDMPAKVIVDKWSVDQAIDWADKKIKEIYSTLGA